MIVCILRDVDAAEGLSTRRDTGGRWIALRLVRTHDLDGHLASDNELAPGIRRRGLSQGCLYTHLGRKI